VHGERTRAGARPQPVADPFALEPKRAYRASLVRRPLTRRGEQAMRDAHRGEVKDGAEMERQAGPARMIPAGRIDEQHIGECTKLSHRGLEQRAFAEREQSGLVRRTCDSGDD
jgi:hypothetical protein